MTQFTPYQSRAMDFVKIDALQKEQARQTRLDELAFREFETEQKAGRQKKLDEADALKASLVGGFAEMALQLPAEQRMSAFETFFGAATQNGVQWDESDMQGFNEALLPILEDDTKLLAFGRGLNPEMALPSVNNPMAATDADGNPVFMQPDGRGGYSEVEGFRPPTRAGESITTNPDGTVTITRGGSGVSSGTRSGLEKEMVSYQDTLGALQGIEEAFDPRYLRYQGRLAAGYAGLKDRIGADLDPDEKQLLEGYSSLVARTNNTLSTVIKQLSGAAVNAAEEKRLRSFIPTDADGPTEFQTKLRDFKRATTMAYMRRAYLLNSGAAPDKIEEIDTVMPLDGVSAAYDRRFHRERDALEARGMTPEEARNEAFRLTDEAFGL